MPEIEKARKIAKIVNFMMILSPPIVAGLLLALIKGVYAEVQEFEMMKHDMGQMHTVLDRIEANVNAFEIHIDRHDTDIAVVQVELQAINDRTNYSKSSQKH